MLFSYLVVSLVASVAYSQPSQSGRFIRRSNALLNTRGELSGSASAVWNNGVELLTEVKIAGKPFEMVLDTGSADFWVFCTDGDDTMETNRSAYNPSTGTELTPKGQFDVKYGSGFAKGSVYMDKVEIGGITVNQAVGCAMSVDAGDVNNRKLDGLVGIGFNGGSKTAPNQVPSATKSALNTVTTLGGGFLGLFKSQQSNAQNTFTENAYPQMKQGLFTLDIRKNANGTYNFGSLNETQFSTAITYMPVINWNHWIVKVSGYQVGTTGMKTVDKKVLIDSGTTYILADSDTTEAYYATIPKATKSDSKSWYVPCKYNDSGVTDFTVQFSPPSLASGIATNFPAGTGGVSREVYKAVVPGKYLIGGASGKKDGMCQGAIQVTSKGNAWDYILGDVFLMSQLVVFDAENLNGMSDKRAPARGQIGFAPKPE